jgi:uncharacterized Rmd1/YagE family protein
VLSPFEQPEAEEVILALDDSKPEGMAEGQISLQAFSIERLQLVAEVLAKSVVLDRYETFVAKSFQRACQPSGQGF